MVPVRLVEREDLTVVKVTPSFFGRHCGGGVPT